LFQKLTTRIVARTPELYCEEMMIPDMKNNMLNNERPWFSLDSFVLDKESQQNIEVVDQLLTSGYMDADVLIIESKMGCGATHLMWGVAQELKSKGDGLVYCNLDYCHLELRSAESGQHRTRISEANSSVLLTYLEDCSYLIIDNFSDQRVFTDMIHRSKHWFRVILMDFLSSGGKLLCTQAGAKKTNDDFYEMLGKFKISEVHLGFPSKEILEKIAKHHFPLELIQQYGPEVYCRSKSVREYVNFFVTIDASKKLNGFYDVKNMLNRYPRIR